MTTFFDEEIPQYDPPGYNPSTGIYASPFIFTGDWENELEAMNYYMREEKSREDIFGKFVADKNLYSGYKYNALRSLDGKESTTEIEHLMDEEIPSTFSYTESYYNSPKIRAICDWFQCDKARIRVFQQQPGSACKIHTDFDNQRGQTSGETVRIFIQLNEMPGGAWFHFKTQDSQVSINLRKGQFLIFNPDHTGHGTENLSDIPRNTIMMVAKRNEWLENLVQQQTVQHIDIDEVTKLNVAA